MKFQHASNVAILLAFSFLFLSEKPALAYIDPGTGSFLIQAVIAFFVSGLVWFKTMFVRKPKITTEQGEETIEDTEDDTDEIT